MDRKKMRLLISGSSGLLGTSLILSLENKGYDIFRLVRKKTEQPNDIFWQPHEGVIEIEKMENFDAVVHLAGESIAGIWTASKKKSIRNSRIDGTRLLSQTVTRLDKPPKLFISASASGFYGDTEDDWVDMSKAKPVTDFLHNYVRIGKGKQYLFNN